MAKRFESLSPILLLTVTVFLSCQAPVSEKSSVPNSTGAADTSADTSAENSNPNEGNMVLSLQGGTPDFYVSLSAEKRDLAPKASQTFKLFLYRLKTDESGKETRQGIGGGVNNNIHISLLGDAVYGQDYVIEGGSVGQANGRSTLNLHMEHTKEFRLKISDRDGLHGKKIIFKLHSLSLYPNHNNYRSYGSEPYKSRDFTVTIKDSSVSCSGGRLGDVKSVDGSNVCTFWWKETAVGEQSETDTRSSVFWKDKENKISLKVILSGTCVAGGRYNYELFCPNAQKEPETNCKGGGLHHDGCYFQWPATADGSSVSLKDVDERTGSLKASCENGEWTEIDVSCSAN